jgi:predicted nicotinamide N-methyase
MMPRFVFSEHLQSALMVARGVVEPTEAEVRILPFLRSHRELVQGKTVLDIGTGTGVIGLYAATLGAKKVVATDINPEAISCADLNARGLKLDGVFETRLVPTTNITAYSAIAPDEVFDAIVSNPPFSIDLEREVNDINFDRGDLGFSLIRGLRSHLHTQGTAILFYGSLFYHQVLVKFARYSRYDVEQEDPEAISPWERDVIFNSYLDRLLPSQGIMPGTFRFDWREEREKHQDALTRHFNDRSCKGLILIRKREF